MSERPKPAISQRKQPRQARSNASVAVILQAAAQVLAKEGAARFTTARVAERAGVSVGTLYQYFPNKAAILFRLQRDEWHDTTRLLADILDDARHTPDQRIHRLVHAFLHSECEEAQMRQALRDAAPLYRDAPEARQPREAADAAFARFMVEALPSASPDQRALASDLLTDVLGAAGKQFSEQPRTPAEIDAYADAMTQMFCAWLDRLGGR
jgi:AcrR family transcriptional regulator